METISRPLLTFLLNSLWQIPLLAALAALMGRLLRRAPASYRHTVWVAALAAAILLPLASIRTAPAGPGPHYDPSLGAATSDVKLVPHAAQVPVPPDAPRRAPIVSLATTTAWVLAAAYGLFLLFRLAGLALAFQRTAAIRRTAQRAEPGELLQRVWQRAEDAFEVRGAELLFSSRVSGPVAAGRTIILPESLAAETSEDVLTTAIGHEMAHLARRDFAWNIFYELLLLPVSFQPAAWYIRRGIEGTREMACDELVTRRLMNAGDYARSIVSIARGMTALPRPGYTLGVFDGDILEERIRRLRERPTQNLHRYRLLLATGLSVLAICAVVASSLAVTARAQGAASELLKQGEAAYNRGDYQAAVQEFDSAVRVEPANVKAKVSLGNALLGLYVPGTNPDGPYITRARQQFLDVLSLDRDNKEALDGLMVVEVNTKRFAEAHQWALRAIGADPKDKTAYYTAAFVDWATAYPDFSRVRQAAGMKLEDGGIIPDASLREGFRTQHLLGIEEGIRMLETAIELDPEYSDAMAYMNLLYRMESGIADTPAESAALIAKADDFVGQAIAAKKKQATPPGGFNLAMGRTGIIAQVAPPPPPPPPPPGGQGQVVPAGTIHVPGDVQQANLLQHPAPIYPPQAQQAGITGTVQLQVSIAKDGTVSGVRIISGNPTLAAAAMDAVRQWTYRPTLLNDQPVEVLSEVSITFGANGK